MEGLNREFVIYQLSSRMKAIGFDELCLAWFVSEEHGLEIGEVVKSDLIKEGILAPTRQSAFRWFREKYNLDSFVKHLYKSTIKVGYYFGIDEYKGVEFQMDFDAWYKTPEEAELACLEKLIEIVESKTK
jgi:hypothetical protein